jgi:hypothetical protein
VAFPLATSAGLASKVMIDGFGFTVPVFCTAAAEQLVANTASSKNTQTVAIRIRTVII